jgi:hypothetical protein
MLSHTTGAVRSWARDVAASWKRFWFTPSAPHTLAAIRILGGCMILYTHLVWTLDLLAFLGPHSWITAEVARDAARGTWAWSHLWYVTSPALLWIMHLAALGVFALLVVGLWTRLVAPLAWLFTISYCHRLSGALFGLDQINSMLAMYLMIGPCGDVWSIDAWRRRRRGASSAAASELTCVATRLIQVYLCVIYLFGGIAKMRGQMWWTGHAFWYSIANYEYQSFDMTWLIHYPVVLALLTHVTVFWEAYYCVLIWPRLTRPLVLAMAVAVHGGIALFLGMPTFGLAMLIGNLAFVRPETIRRLGGAIRRRGKGECNAK